MESRRAEDEGSKKTKETFHPHLINRPQENQSPGAPPRAAASPNTQASSHRARSHGDKPLVHRSSNTTQVSRKRRVRSETGGRGQRAWAMEGLIPFVIDAIRRSHERGGYRCVSPDGSSHGGGSRRHLIDYWELPGAAEDVQMMSTEHRRPAAVVAGSAYIRK
ncbi:hypothetical protein ABZP36_001624 [Zizania latifolia]